MAKTDALIINCARADISPYDKNKVSVDLVDLDITHVLDDIYNDDITEWCERNLQPEDIFSETQLEKWAAANGYVKGGDNDV